MTFRNNKNDETEEAIEIGGTRSRSKTARRTRGPKQTARKSASGFELRNDIPVPVGRLGNSWKPKYPLTEMKAGESFFVSSVGKNPNTHPVRFAVSGMQKLYGGLFTCHRVVEGGVVGLRVWCLKPVPSEAARRALLMQQRYGGHLMEPSSGDPADDAPVRRRRRRRTRPGAGIRRRREPVTSPMVRPNGLDESASQEIGTRGVR